MALPAGIARVGAYLPRLRLPRARIAEAIGWANPQARAQAAGARAVCNWDEDSLTLAVEAARRCLADHDRQSIDALTLASTTFPFADRDNAALVCGALDLADSARTSNLGSSLRAGADALVDAARQREQTSLVVAADARRARPGSSQELTFGHGAAAFLLTNDARDAIAVVAGSAHITADFVDHYRMAGEDFDYALEDRWVREEAYAKLVPRAIGQALANAGLNAESIQNLVMPCPGAIAKRIATASGLNQARIADSLHANCGETGVAHPLLMLALALESTAAGEHLVVVGFGQGVTAFVVSAQPAIDRRQPTTVTTALAHSVEEQSYVRYLAHSRLLDVDFGMRAERDNRTAQSVAYRKRRDVTAFVGGRCAACGTVQYPRSRVCVNPECRKSDTQAWHRLAESTGRVKSFTEDWQAYSPRPPYIYGNVEFQEGGNLLMEFTDLEPGEIAVDAPVRFVFRIKDVDRMRGFQRYFWKATRA
jgi:3-hydroxy-3-methylglutaryl CoA synthase